MQKYHGAEIHEFNARTGARTTLISVNERLLDDLHQQVK